MNSGRNLGWPFQQIYLDYFGASGNNSKISGITTILVRQQGINNIPAFRYFEYIFQVKRVWVLNQNEKPWNTIVRDECTSLKSKHILYTKLTIKKAEIWTLNLCLEHEWDAEFKRSRIKLAIYLCWHTQLFVSLLKRSRSLKT